ncbi:N-acetylglucosaminyldiphosphoundecaprenol N-acetyl-beta-D-mannosaminyltransferase [Alkalibacillus flavidus]|uniref:N-acetylglucosaminyldiphosphoundecaprenol N-acetyl-beta-D-mannosaminyltransferase n=1 Tax=Alkalibacillus flavidus TaxID=546021 RepID=A0ABV2KXA5_9BACI
MKVVKFLGIPFLYIDQAEFINLMAQRIEDKDKTFVVTVNPESAMIGQRDQHFMNVLHRATHVTADGIGIVKGVRLVGDYLPERVTGYDSMIGLLERGNEHGYRVFLLGGREDVVQEAAGRVSSRYPGLDAVDYHHGYFDFNDESVIDAIKAFQPNLVLVGLGVPRQEQWIDAHFDKFDQGVFIGVGGSIDVLGGYVKRAPETWRRLNLEWLYRFLHQPSRWRRAFVLPQFIGTVLKKRFKS